jgi:allophanate hydrolase subunit 1
MACYRRGISVTVVNEGSVAVTDVTLHYAKDRAEAAVSLGNIEANKAEHVRLVNDAESNLVISFRGPDGSQHKQPIDVYLENSHEPIKLHITRDYTVRCEGC